MNRSLAWPLALCFAVLIAYASLYPFDGWRLPPGSLWSFLALPWPRYWTAFDLTANLVGYGPLGFLVALGLLRSGWRFGAVLVATVVGSAWSLGLETMQVLLPSRVPSNVDWGLNTLGVLCGSLIAWLGLQLGLLTRWSQFRDRWFVPGTRAELVLLALWPPALLFPAPVPLGLGQVLERLEETLADWLMDTPFLEWVPVREVELQPLLPGAELVAVLLGALVPCLLAYSVVRDRVRRVALGLVLAFVAVGVSALSAALSFGPAHAWAWLTPPVRAGLLGYLVAALITVPLPRRGCAALALVAVTVHLALLNNAPQGAYFSQTLQAWEQGRFIRFHGLAQWIGWLWPFATLGYLLMRLSGRESDPASLMRR